MPRPRRLASRIAPDPHQKVVAANNRIIAALRARRKKWFAIDGVLGFGVGGLYPHLTALFVLDMTLSPARRRKARKRLPRWILVGKQRVPIETMELGPLKLLLARIGDPSKNRESKRVDGAGQWEMGARIQVFDKPSGDKLLGTAGCVVKYTDPKKPQDEMVLTCRHVVVKAGNDVAQWEQDKTVPPPPQVPQKKDLHNYVGISGEVTTGPIDGGLIKEVSGQLKTIIDIGAPKAPQEVEQYCYVRKSGGSTGYTYGQIVSQICNLNDSAGAVTLIDCWLVPNVCVQKPNDKAAQDALKEDPKKTAKPDTPPDLFADESDSGALVVLGLPEENDVFGGVGISAALAMKTGSERQAFVDRFYGAAVGLVVAKAPSTFQMGGTTVTRDCAVVQKLQTITAALGVTMVT